MAGLCVLAVALADPLSSNDVRLRPRVTTTMMTALRRVAEGGVLCALALAMVQALGGALSLESDLGHGSRFSFTIPVTTTR